MIVLLVFVLAAPPPDVATQLATAEHSIAQLEYAEARDTLLELVADPRATEAELMRAHMLAGEVDRVLERDVDARMHFLWVLARDPHAQMPADRPPKIRTFFELVRDEAVGRAAERPKEAPPATDTWPMAPLVLVVAGSGAALAGASVGALGEATFATTGAGWESRSTGQTTAIIGWTVCAAGVTAAVSGGALWGNTR